MKFKLGTCLLFITTILYVGKYISATILVNNVDFPSDELLDLTLRAFPTEYNILMLASLLFGLLFIVLGLFSEHKNNKKNLNIKFVQ